MKAEPITVTRQHTETDQLCEDLNIPVKDIVEFVESSFAENYSCSLYEMDSVWGLLLEEHDIPNTLPTRKACYHKYISYLQSDSNEPTSDSGDAGAQYINKPYENEYPIPDRCTCKYVPTSMLRETGTQGHVHCPTCRQLVPYSHEKWHKHVLDSCYTPKEDSDSASGNVQVCLVCTRTFSCEERLRRHWQFNHYTEANIDFSVAYQVDQLRGLFVVVNFGQISATAVHFVKQHTTAYCMSCCSDPTLKNCPHYRAVLQNVYPCDSCAYSIPDSILSMYPSDLIMKYRVYAETAAACGVPAIVLLKTPPHSAVVMYSFFDEDNLLKRSTVTMLNNNKSICTCKVSSKANCWHRMLAGIAASDQQKLSMFTLDEMKLFLKNCRTRLRDSMLCNFNAHFPSDNATAVVLDRMVSEITKLSHEVHALRNDRLSIYGSLAPVELPSEVVPELGNELVLDCSDEPLDGAGDGGGVPPDATDEDLVNSAAEDSEMSSALPPRRRRRSSSLMATDEVVQKITRRSTRK